MVLQGQVAFVLIQHGLIKQCCNRSSIILLIIAHLATNVHLSFV
jgi:hypothetical protein